MTDYKLLHTLRMMAATQGTHSGEGAGGREAGGRLAELAADRIEELDAKLAKVLEALGEAIYLLDPDEEDIAKKTGLHRIVTTYTELTSSEAANGEAKGGNDE